MAKKKLHGIETIRKMNEQTSTITEGASKGKETAVIVVHSKSDSQEARQELRDLNCHSTSGTSCFSRSK